MSKKESIQFYIKRKIEIHQTLDEVMAKLYPSASHDENGIYFIRIKKSSLSSEDLIYIKTYGIEDFIDYSTCTVEAEKWSKITSALHKSLRAKGIEVDPYILHDEYVYPRVGFIPMRFDHVEELIEKAGSL